MLAVAIGIDKAELLSGRATVREERPLVVTPEEAQRELAELNDVLQARRAAREAADRAAALNGHRAAG